VASCHALRCFMYTHILRFVVAMVCKVTKRRHVAIAAKSLRCRLNAITAESLHNHCQIASLRNRCTTRCAIVAQSLRNHSAITAESLLVQALGNRGAIRPQSNCNRFRICCEMVSNRFAIAKRSLHSCLADASSLLKHA
jgi:hypothetical protein